MCAVINPELERLAGARYVSLTTFDSDGTPTATPVRVVSEGGFLQVLTSSGSGAAQRLRSNRQATVGPCDLRGSLQGDPVPATATVIDDPELVARVERLLADRYGALVRLVVLLRRLLGKDAYVALAIDVPAPPPA